MMNASDNGLLTSPPLARKRSRSPDTAAASMTSPTRDSTIGVLAALPPPAAPGPTPASSTSAPILSSGGDLTSPPSTGAGVPNAGILAALPAPDDVGLILTGGATSQLPTPTAAPVSVPVPGPGPGPAPAPTTKGKKKKNDSSSMFAELQRTEIHRDATTAATAQSVVSVKTSFGVVGTPAPSNSAKPANDAPELSTTAAASAPPPPVHKTVFTTPFAALGGGSSTSSLTTKPATTVNAPNASNTSSAPSGPSGGAATQGAATTRSSTGTGNGAPTSASAAPVSGDFIVPSAKAPTSATAAAVKAVMHPTMVSAFANGTVGSVVGGTTSAGADAAMHQPPVALSNPAMPLRVSSTSVVKIAQSAVLPGNVPLSFAKMWSEYAALHDEVRAIVAKRKTTTDVPIDADKNANVESNTDVKTTGDEDAQVPSSSADVAASSSSSAASCSDVLARIDAFEARAAQTLGGSKATAPPSEEEAAAAKARAENVVDAEVWYRLRARWAVAVASGQLLDEEEGGEPWWVALERWATEKKARKNATA